MKLISEIIESENLRTLSFIFFNLGKQKQIDTNRNGFEINIEYRKSKHYNMDLTDNIAKVNNELLINYSELPFNIITSTNKTIRHRTEIINDTVYSRKEILYRIYAKIEQNRFLLPKETFEKIISSSFFIPRGSIDLKRNFWSVDVLNHNVSEQYIESLLSILTSLTSLNQLNFNFRELQPEYLEGKNRNTQLRINLRWFFEHYLDEFKLLNLFKYNLLLDNKGLIELSNYSSGISTAFIERAIFYKEKILKKQDDLKKLSKKQINQVVKEYRKELKFEDSEIESDQIGRNQSLVKLAIISQPDICHSCHEKYSLDDRTFRMRGNGRPFLELHHVISFGADKSGDVIENLVKLCPACHRALTPNRAEEEYQKKIISNILYHSEDAYDYVRLFLNESADENDAVDFVYSNLK